MKVWRHWRGHDAGDETRQAGTGAMPFPLRLRHPPKPAPPASTLPSNHSAAGSGVSAIETSPLVVSVSSIPRHVNTGQA
jgi:hypothetical protein